MPEDEEVTQPITEDEVTGDYFRDQVLRHLEELEVERETKDIAFFNKVIKNWVKAAGGGLLQPLPLSPQTVEFRLTQNERKQYGWQEVETGPMYTEQQVIAMLTDEMGAPLNEKLTKAQIAAAGLPQYTPPPLVGQAAFGYDTGSGVVYFGGNWQAMPAHGTEAVDNRTGKPYVFWRRGNSASTGPAFGGYWLSPARFDHRANNSW